MDALRREQAAVTNQAVPGSVVAYVPDPSGSQPNSGNPEVERAGSSELREELEVLQAEIKQHDQSKLESLSKYPVRVYGLILFNSFSNAGVVDNPDLPSSAFFRVPGTSHGSVSATLRQTLFGIQAFGPKIWAATTAADISADFFGDIAYTSYGSSAGALRLRRADISLDWQREGSRDEVHLGVDAPLISPLSPTSYATVAQPALAWSGNLWTWEPQLRYKHTLAVNSANTRTLQFEGGLWDPPGLGSDPAGSTRALSPGELARVPGLEGRVSVHAGAATHPFSLGVGGYSDEQLYNSGQKIRTYAVTADWQLPLAPHVELEGEFYRGRGLGGLGGGAYKDVLTGLDVRTGVARTLGLNAIGGWTQLKNRINSQLELNGAFGLDQGFASDFHQLDLGAKLKYPASTTRTQSLFGNVIYRPKTYLILSPEYRHISSWNIGRPVYRANIYTFSLGFEF
ncbi:MAG: hypothetical protein ABI197_09075 [Granulicella sp.]